MANIRADVTADTKDFVRGVENAEKALETLVDSMDDAQKESVRDASKIEESLKDVARAAKDAGDSAKPMGDGFKRASKEANEGLEEVKEESKSTAREAAASFDGSAESIVDAFQEVAANAFAGFGPAGLAAGLAVAAGIGIATTEFQKNAEQAEEAKQRVREFGLAVIESGAEVAGLEQFQENLKAIVTESDDAAKKLGEIDAFAKRFKKYGADADTLAMAFAGNADAIDDMVGSLEDAVAEERALADLATNKGTRDLYLTRANDAQAYIDELIKVQEETQRAQEIEQNWLASGGAEALAKQQAIETINSAYDEVVNSVSDYINAETGIFDIEAYVSSIKAREEALLNYQNLLAASGLTTEQKQALDAMGVDQATAILNGLQDPSVAQETKDYLKQSLTNAASESSGVARDKVEETFKKPVKAEVKAEADLEDARKSLNTFIDQKRYVTIQARIVDREGKEYP